MFSVSLNILQLLTLQVDLLASNFYTMKEIYLRWLELGERVGHMAVEGELSLWPGTPANSESHQNVNLVHF